jgi:hypothetical protein
MKLPLSDTRFDERAAASFATAAPFPLVVVDDFLPAPVAEGLLAEIGRCQSFEKSNDYIFAKNKFENPRLEQLGPSGDALRTLLLSDDFAQALSRMYGRTLFVDAAFTGGGLHRGGEGSYLDMHVDFGLHPGHREWIRELNLLLYLNKDWRPEYGGHLQLRHGTTGETAAIEPRFNRMVMMITKDYTFHGYRPIAFPPGTFRTSIAAYAYSLAVSAEETANLLTTTQWDPEGGGALKKAVAKVTPGLVAVKQKLFGSATARKK